MLIDLTKGPITPRTCPTHKVFISTGNAHLSTFGLHRCSLTGADADAARVRALAAYKDFLALWKDADPERPPFPRNCIEFRDRHTETRRKIKIDAAPSHRAAYAEASLSFAARSSTSLAMAMLSGTASTTPTGPRRNPQNKSASVTCRKEMCSSFFTIKGVTQ